MMTQKSKYSFAERVNSDVNASVKYKTDLERYSVSDWWIEANGYGDCEDYALLKRHILLENGWLLSDCCITCCWVETGDYHCVLLVNTDKGWYILDNRYQWPMSPTSLPYKWDKVLREDGKWYELIF